MTPQQSFGPLTTANGVDPDQTPTNPKIWMLVLPMLLVGSMSAALKAEQSRPNIIYMLTDDVSAEEFAIYGVHNEHATPNVDRLVREGTTFRTCWATPLCLPTRHALMAGKYGFRTKVFHNALRPFHHEQNGLLPKYHTVLPEVLRRNGYATYFSGKFHLSGNYRHMKDYGFEEYCLYADNRHQYPKTETFDGASEDERGVFAGRNSAYWHPAVNVNGHLLDTDENDFGPDIYLNHAIDFIKRKKDKPFFLYYANYLSHEQPDYLAGHHLDEYIPVPERDRHGKKTGRKKAGSLKNGVEYLDYLLGRLLKTLDEKGLRENTYIIFTGDNATVRKGKGSLSEQGVLVPLVVRGPGVKAGVVSGALTDITDSYPTVLEMAGIAMPANEVFDGTSFLPVLEGKKAKTRDWIFSQLTLDRIIRDERWYLDKDGRLFDCGNSRNHKVKKYKNVTNSKAPEVLAARQRFEKLLEQLPGPDPVKDKFIIDRYTKYWAALQKEWKEKGYK